MGNLQTKSMQLSHQNLNEYTQIGRQNNGIILQCKKTQNTFFLKESSYINKKQYQCQFKKLQTLQSQPQNQNILALVRLFSQTFNNICSNSYKIYALYQYPSITLQQEILARKKQNKYFQQCQLWSILQSCANALSELNPSISLHPKNVYIVPDGILKVINNQMIDEDYRCYIKDHIYYAPQKITDFKKNDTQQSLRKQSIFSLGMTVLHAALLHPVNNCYNYLNFQFSKQLLQKYIEQFVMIKNLSQSKVNKSVRMYSQQFIQTLALILQPFPNKRISLSEIHQMLNKIWNSSTEDNQKQYQNQQLSFNQSQQQQNSAIKKLQQKTNNVSQHVQPQSVKPLTKNTQTNRQSIHTKNQTISQNQTILPSINSTEKLTKPQLQPQPYPNCNTKPSVNFTMQNIPTAPVTVTIPNNYYHYSYIPQYRPLNAPPTFYPNPRNIQNINKQNSLYTDPKLLEMIKKDIRDINQLKKSSMINTYEIYPPSSSYTGNNSSRYYSPFGENNIVGASPTSKGSLVNTLSHRITPPSIQTGALSQRNQNISPATIKQQKPEQVKCQPQTDNGNAKDKKQPQPKGQAVNVAQEYEDGRKFEGTVINGVKHGRGKLTYSDGAYYQGDFVDDKMQGKGTLFYGPGKPAYQGNWLADQFHGHGVLHNQNPLQLNGCFNYNDFNLIEDFWTKYQGNFDYDNKSGQGKLILSNGEQFHGNFNNDFVHGKGVFYTQQGQEIQGVWEQNIMMNPKQ